MLFGCGEQPQQVVEFRSGGVARGVSAGRQFEPVDRIAGDLSVALAPLEGPAQQRPRIVHPAPGQPRSTHPAEGLVEFGHRDRTGPLLADRFFEPTRVHVGIAGECRVVQAALLAGELDVPRNQRVDGQQLVVLAQEVVSVADLGDKRSERLGRFGSGAVNSSKRTPAPAESIHTRRDADPPDSGGERRHGSGTACCPLRRRGTPGHLAAIEPEVIQPHARRFVNTRQNPRSVRQRAVLELPRRPCRGQQLAIDAYLPATARRHRAGPQMMRAGAIDPRLEPCSVERDDESLSKVCRAVYGTTWCLTRSIDFLSSSL